MSDRPDDICPAPQRLPPQPTRPHVPAIYPAAVYECDSPDEARRLLSGELPGYVYQRDRHPNADLLAEKCRQLHGAAWVQVCGSGMSALSAALLGHLAAGDQVVVSDQLYGRSLQLWVEEAPRLGIACSTVDTRDLAATAAAITPRTRMIVVETITNPLLHVADIRRLAEIAHAAGAALLVDNTFATPVLCRPLTLGADLVVESVSKMMNGHGDVMLGLVCGQKSEAARLQEVVAVWGLASSPLDCWLAARGLGTLHLRIERACRNAQQAAEMLLAHQQVASVAYPGLAGHPDHELAADQFGGRFGTVVSFHLAGGLPAAERFIAAARRIPFCPSLGELSTTLSHPQSTSHRRLSAAQLARLGITGGTIRLSVGTESEEAVCDALREALDVLTPV